MKLPVLAGGALRSALAASVPVIVAPARGVRPSACLGFWCTCPNGDHVCCQDGQSCNNNPPPSGQCQCKN
jgi:hypothetical protein